ncbi:MAG: GIY-YIG nuclease family protein [Nitrososphaeria archaeon]
MKGTYILIIELKKHIKLKIGSLGSFDFPQGFYYYVGSALNNLEARIARHIKIAEKKSGKKRWHIDYLLSNKEVRLKGIVLLKGKVEHKIANKLDRKFLIVAKKFGSSDCGCVTHLFFSKKFKPLQIVF